jgi:hypothetical protein
MENAGAGDAESSMRRRLFVTLLAAAVSACGGDSTGSAANGIPASSLAGAWTLTLGDSLPCPDTLASRDLVVAVAGTDDDIQPAGSLTFTERWSIAGGDSGTVYGTINVLSRSVVLHLVRQDSLGYALEVRGALDDNLELRGVAQDPYPGYEPLLVSSQCTFTVQGTRTSP